MNIPKTVVLCGACFSAAVLSGCTTFDEVDRYVTEHNIKGKRICASASSGVLDRSVLPPCQLSPVGSIDGDIPDEDQASPEEGTLRP